MMPMVIVIMGVTGAGKTTIGTLLAEELGWSFYDADAFHPGENVERMRTGEPLREEHRDPWLAALEALIAQLLADGDSAVIACSALRSSYRDRLLRPAARGLGDVRLVFLAIPPAAARERLRRRIDHFMPANLVDSQFEDLEIPAGVLEIDATLPPNGATALIRRELRI
jgi:gluconokinase